MKTKYLACFHDPVSQEKTRTGAPFLTISITVKHRTQLPASSTSILGEQCEEVISSPYPPFSFSNKRCVESLRTVYHSSMDLDTYYLQYDGRIEWQKPTFKATLRLQKFIGKPSWTILNDAHQPPTCPSPFVEHSRAIKLPWHTLAISWHSGSLLSTVSP